MPPHPVPQYSLGNGGRTHKTRKSVREPKVQQRLTYTAERFLFVMTSSAPGRNNGLFLCLRQYKTPKDRYICVYTEVLVPSDDAESLQGQTIWSLSKAAVVRPHTTVRYSIVICNYGSFADDLGLQQTIDYAVQYASLATYSYIAKRDVGGAPKTRQTASSEKEGRERVARDGSYLLQPRTSRLELSVSYGFTYWTVVVARTPNRLPSAISDPVLWVCLVATQL